MANKQVIGFEINGINIPLGDVSEPIVDSIFDENSVHPVQNKTITEEFSKKANKVSKEILYNYFFKPSNIDLREGIVVSLDDTELLEQVAITEIQCGYYDSAEGVLTSIQHTMSLNKKLGEYEEIFSIHIDFDDKIKDLCKKNNELYLRLVADDQNLKILGHQELDLADIYYGLDHPLKKGDYSNSYVLEKGKALSPMSFASGQDADDENSSVVAIAGCKGFYYYSYSDYGNSQNKIELSTSQPIGQKNSPRTWDDASQALLSKWKGKKINIVGSHKHTMCATVKEVREDGQIITSKLPFGEKIPFTTSYYSGISWGQSSYDWDDGAIYCPELPEAGTVILGRGARSIGPGSVAAGTYSVAEGKETLAANDFAHAEGRWTKAGYASHAEGYSTEAIGQGAHSEGHNTNASAHSSHAEGKSTAASGSAAHAEGVETQAIGEGSHAEGNNTIANGQYAHAEGFRNTDAKGAVGTASHVEGVNGEANGNYSHVEGLNCKTKTGASGAHAQGEWTEANAQYSHAEGWHTKIDERCGHVQGKYNDLNFTTGYAHIVGGGTSENDRKNIHTLDWNGNASFAGSITMLGNKKFTTKNLLITYTDDSTEEIEMVVIENV